MVDSGKEGSLEKKQDCLKINDIDSECDYSWRITAHSQRDKQTDTFPASVHILFSLLY